MQGVGFRQGYLRCQGGRGVREGCGACPSRLLAWRSGFRIQGSGFRVQGSGFRVQGSGFRVQGTGFVEASCLLGAYASGVVHSKFRVQGIGFRVSVSGFKIYV